LELFEDVMELSPLAPITDVSAVLPSYFEK
jgi:hypothetical protein